jgi:osmotically inducible protein OsmC
MALSNVLAEDGTPPTSLETRADLTFDPPNITGIKLTVRGVVPGITAEQFEKVARTRG